MKIHETEEKDTKKFIKNKLTNMKEKLLMTLEKKMDMRNYGTLSTH